MNRTLRTVAFCILIVATCAPIATAEEFFIRFNDGTDRLANEKWLKDAGVRVLQKYQVTRAILCETIEKNDGLIEELRSDPRVANVEPNHIYHVCAVPNDESFGNQWALQNTGQTGGTPGADIAAVEAWDMIAGADEVLVGIMDTGIEYTHPDLVNRMWDGGAEFPNHGYDFANSDNDPIDTYHHGTHVAGIVAAEANNGIGIVGVASNAKLMALKVAYDGVGEIETDAIFAAMDFCIVHGVDVINASYGSPEHDPNMEEAIQSLNNVGIVFVAAAGNDAIDLDEGELFYPACYDVANVISVASTDHNDELSSFSNHGSEFVDVAAPGSWIFSTYIGGMYLNSSGTSMAAPQVTGAVAMLLGAHAAISPSDVRAMVMTGVDPLPQLSRAVISGGRLNLVRMLAAADDIAPGAITDLAVVRLFANHISVAWTAVGNDGYTGTAYRNDLRYSLDPILGQSDFDVATLVHDLSAPRSAGQYESLNVTGLQPSTTYYLALRVGDEAGNWSPLTMTTGATASSSVATLDETPLSYSAYTGKKQTHFMEIHNDGAGSLSYLVKAVSVGLAKTAGDAREPVPPTLPYESEEVVRASGRGKGGPSGASGFFGLDRSPTAKSADWGTTYYDDLESAGDWTADLIDGSNLWHYSTAAYNSPIRSLAFVDEIAGDYATGDTLDVAMTSGGIDLTQAEGNVFLEFFEWYSTEPGYDFCDVEVSDDAGVTWNPVRTGVSGDSEGWRLTSVDFSAYAGEFVNVRFRFHTGDEIYNDYPGWYIDDVSVRDDGTSWLAFVYGAGTVKPYGSRSIAYQVDATGLCAGTYSAEIQVHTNDPANTLFTVPVDVAVTSAPDLYYGSVGLDMEHEFVGYTKTRTVILENLGCEPLFISSLASSSPDFVVELQSPTIDAGGSTDLTVAFAPSAAGSHFALITFSTNDPDEMATTLVAFGTGDLVPAVVLPDSVYSYQIVGETISHRSFEIRNEGDGILNWQFAGDVDANGAPVTVKRVLWDTDKAYNRGFMHQTQIAEAGYLNQQLEDLAPDGLSITQEYLNNTDVLVLYGDRNSGEYYTAGELAMIRDWVLDGGSLFIDFRSYLGYMDINQFIADLGCDTRFVRKSISGHTMTNIQVHALSTGVNSVYGAGFMTLENVNTPMTPLMTAATGDVVSAFGIFGQGRVVLMTATPTGVNFLSLADNAVLAGNIIAWLATGAPGMTPSIGTVAPGASQVVDVSFDSTDILSGTYVYEFFVASNDPATPVASVSATYEVEGVGHLQLSESAFSIGLVYAGADTTTVIEIINTGNAPVTVRGTSVTDPRFVMIEPSFLLQAKERRDMPIGFLAGAEGFTAAEIAMTTDAPGQATFSFLIDANPQLPHPVLSTSDLGEQNLFTGGNAARTFDLSNNGLWPLDYLFTNSGDASRIRVSGESGGVLESNATRTVGIS